MAYLRTSSATNVGDDKDTLKRQREAVSSFARRVGYDALNLAVSQLIAEYGDDGVKGADPVDTRPGFAAMLEHLASNGVHTVIVETASRFARDLITQETGWRLLRDAGITLIAADSPEAFLDATPTAMMVRQILRSVSQFEKAMLVAKLRSARERKKRETGKCGGRQSYAERRPVTVALAKKLALMADTSAVHRRSSSQRGRSVPCAPRRSLRPSLASRPKTVRRLSRFPPERRCSFGVTIGMRANSAPQILGNLSAPSWLPRRAKRPGGATQNVRRSRVDTSASAEPRAATSLRGLYQTDAEALTSLSEAEGQIVAYRIAFRRS